MKNMNILMCSSKEFSMAAYVIMESFIENNPEYKITFYFAATDNIEDSEAMKKFVTQKGHEFIFIQLDISFFLQFKTQNKWTHVTYMKLMMHEYLPKDVDRILYFDMDAICNGSIEEFYEVDFEDNYIAACANPINPQKIDEYNNMTEINESMAVNGNYFNAGIVLFNLEKIRKEITTQMIIDAYEYCVKRANRYVADQSILNCLYCKKTKYLNSLDYNYRLPCELSEERNLHQNPKMAIIHYISQNMPYKPWDILLDDKDIENIIEMPFEWGYIYISKHVVDLIKIWWNYAEKTPIYDVLYNNMKIKKEWFMVYGVTATNMVTREQNKNKAFKRRCGYLDEQKDNIIALQSKNHFTFLEALNQYWNIEYNKNDMCVNTFDDCENLFSYLEHLVAQDNEYILLMTVHHTAIGHWNEFLERQNLGLTKQLRHCDGYCAICSTKDRNILIEASGKGLQKIDYVLGGNANINISGGNNEKMVLEIYNKTQTFFTCVSKGFDPKLNTVRSQILINNINYSMSKRGLNFAVFCVNKNTVVDAFFVDVHGDEKFIINRTVS